uniref:Uncharacterized protein n=1 Tax=Chromera velia CCMP2878 TaxID=1169474 RepID=A0A0G4ID11_9ALVE|eukprot:Cvel_115.t1-p1 / transcript=Cvel_115.t1 / gene=Cvel_115 / organism=Chromera_velia_CCMP2878 / gene_product=hypothetical protein / transcript_product=hypothetical protein / location=Cvel_scaffold8:189804-190973(+) / protein_length=390 / sequence_SO=supercontig / SO=protein_coding / is_pseudo=false
MAHSALIDSRRDSVCKTLSRIGAASGVPLILGAPSKRADAVEETAEVTRFLPISDEMFSQKLLNLPPKAFKFPPFMEGEWECVLRFEGVELPAGTSLQQVGRKTRIPGFRRYSVAWLADVGFPNVRSVLRFVKEKGKGPVGRFGLKEGQGGILEDRACNLRELMRGFTDGKADVYEVLYESSEDPNRCRLAYRDNKGEGKIQLFTNRREILWKKKKQKKKSANTADASPDPNLFISGQGQSQSKSDSLFVSDNEYEGFETVEAFRQVSFRRGLRSPEEEIPSQSFGDYIIRWDLSQAPSRSTLGGQPQNLISRSSNFGREESGTVSQEAGGGAMQKTVGSLERLEGCLQCASFILPTDVPPQEVMQTNLVSLKPSIVFNYKVEMTRLQSH